MCIYREEVSSLFSTVRGPGSSLGVMVGLESSSSLRRASSIRRTVNTGTANLKRKSLCLQVKFQTVSSSVLNDDLLVVRVLYITNYTALVLGF